MATRTLGQLALVPRFWSDRSSLLSDALLPLSRLYALGARANEALAPPPYVAPFGRRPSNPLVISAGRRCRTRRGRARGRVPVICVGGAVAGGSGKTPVALSLASRLAATGTRVHFLTRGYGGTARGPLRVHSGQHDAHEVGDEALMLAAVAPTWVATRRACAAAAACAAVPAPQVLVMDDGLQHHTLRRDVGLLVVDALYLLGNRRVLPAGPLREPFERALARADAVIAVAPFADERAASVGAGAGAAGGAPPSEAALRAALGVRAALPLLRARQRPAAAAAAAVAGARVLAFSGVARPQRFFAALDALGCDVAEAWPLPDHAALPPMLLATLRARAAALGARLATTAKDAARLPRAERERTDLAVLRMELHWEPEAEAALCALLQPIVPPR